MATSALRPFWLAAVLFGLGSGMARAQPAPTVCEAAGTAAELQHGVPAGLLNAIGRVESGRRDPVSGRVAAWPWAINAEGRGTLFDSQAEALSGTRALQAGGMASIDVGCFQVNLMHHRTAFSTLEEAFDPARNAEYAARFLLALRNRAGSWEQAVADYHSANPERGLPYRDRVLAGWAGGDSLSLAAAVPAPRPVAPVAGPVMVRMVAWAPTPGAGMRIWTPSAPGQGASVITMPTRQATPARLPRG